MSGSRRPMSVNLANGGKHWTKDEIELRQSTEAVVQKPKTLTPPKWLNADAKKLFRIYAKELLANLPVSKLDTGTLARLCDAEVLYARAAKQRDICLDDPEQDVSLWMKTMVSAEKIARGCASDLGCTISSRCRMVVPRTDDSEEDPLERLMLLDAKSG